MDHLASMQTFTPWFDAILLSDFKNSVFSCRKDKKEAAKKFYARVITHNTSTPCDNTANTVGYFF